MAIFALLAPILRGQNAYCYFCKKWYKIGKILVFCNKISDQFFEKNYDKLVFTTDNPLKIKKMWYSKDKTGFIPHPDSNSNR